MGSWKVFDDVRHRVEDVRWTRRSSNEDATRQKCAAPHIPPAAWRCCMHAPATNHYEVKVMCAMALCDGGRGLYSTSRWSCCGHSKLWPTRAMLAVPAGGAIYMLFVAHGRLRLAPAHYRPPWSLRPRSVGHCGLCATRDRNGK